MNPAWPEMETGFAQAVIDRDLALPRDVAGPVRRAARGFAVYRTNFRVNLVDAVRTGYPVTAQITGDEFFTAMAIGFVSRHPPRSPVLMEYGGELPSFIDTFEPANSVPYLGDVARLENAWNESYHEREALSLKTEALRNASPHALATAGILLHPSLRLVRSSHPVGSIWFAHQSGEHPSPVQWSPEEVVIVRPEATVQVFVLPPGYADFIDALLAGECIQHAAACALSVSATFDAGTALLALFSYGAVVALSPDSTPLTSGYAHERS